jgi:hypothetical protein
LTLPNVHLPAGKSTAVDADIWALCKKVVIVQRMLDMKLLAEVKTTKAPAALAPGCGTLEPDASLKQPVQNKPGSGITAGLVDPSNLG